MQGHFYKMASPLNTMNLRSLYIKIVPKKSVVKKMTFTLSILLGLAVLFVALCNYVVIKHSRGRMYSNIDDVPYNKVGLLFGTSKYIKNGSPNPFFQNRIKAAADLYYAKKIDYVILSGDNQFSYYNEPQDMRKALRYMQVPDSVLVMDYAGFRTFDSVIRCFKVFGQTKFTLISQEFQNKRGIYIARKEGLDVVGYNAEDVDFRMGIKTSVREVLARVNVVLDIYLFHTQPKFLGKKIKL